MLRRIGILLIVLAALLFLTSPPQASAAVRFGMYVGQPVYTYYPAYTYTYTPYPYRYYYYRDTAPVYYSYAAPVHVYSYTTRVHRHHVKQHRRHVSYRY